VVVGCLYLESEKEELKILKIAIIGADGQLGSDLCKIIDKREQIPLTISDIDITNIFVCDTVVKKIRPDIIINTAAYHRVDDCEDNDLEAYKVNSHGVKNLALACKGIKALLVHISTDYVFDGDKGSPYIEDDIPNPKTAYGISKLAGEQFIRYLCDKYFIVRTSGLYGAAGCLGKGGGNFVENMIKRFRNGESLSIVDDETITPTYTRNLAENINKLIRTEYYGLYHVTNNGECTWWEYANKIFEILGVGVNIKKTNSKNYEAKAQRPKYSVLQNKRLKEIGLDCMPSWEKGLQEYLVEKGHVKNIK